MPQDGKQIRSGIGYSAQESNAAISKKLGGPYPYRKSASPHRQPIAQSPPSYPCLVGVELSGAPYVTSHQQVARLISK